ncbi:MAG: LLM class flavin-dependent oxidoreductase, partial [Dehalococcoidia bacterium]
MERIGVAFTGGLTPPEVVECVTLAEELGYESAWVAEGHGGDQFSILTACAVATQTILLGTSISSVFVRSAPTVAMAAACVDHFSQGRFVLGLGTSHKVQVEGEHGLAFSQPIPQLRAYVDIVRGLLRDGEISHQGEIFEIKGFDLQFEPFRPEIPIYVAAVFPKMLGICGEIAQGALLTWCTPESARRAADHVARGAEQAGKSPQEVEVATLLP